MSFKVFRQFLVCAVAAVMFTSCALAPNAAEAKLTDTVQETVFQQDFVLPFAG